MTVVMLVMAMPVMVVMVVIMRMMLVSMMAVAVTAMAMVVMRVALMAVGMMGMDIMGVAVRGSLGIGAAFGIERRFDLDEARVQPSHHRLDHMIAADAQSSCRDLGRQMPVAEVPGKPDQMLRIAASDFKERLGRSHHLDQPAIFEHQRVATAQDDRSFQIEQEFQPTRALHRHPPAVAIVKIEHDAIGRRFAPTMLA